MSERQVALVINPTSGSGKGAKAAPIAARRLRERGMTVTEIIGGSAEESASLARRAVSEGVGALVAVGGDGTVHQTLQAVAGTEVPFGIIPVGTGDDNARQLRIPLKDIEAAADVIADGRTRSIDLGYATTADGVSEYFLAVLSVGFDSEVSERANKMTWPSGQLKYIRAILSTLAAFKPLTFELTLDGQNSEAEAMLICFGNGGYYGGAMHICPGAILDDGLLDVTELTSVSKFNFMKQFPSVYKGTHVNSPFVKTQRVKAATIHAPGQIAYADGERIGPTPASVEIRPQALNVLVPVAH